MHTNYFILTFTDINYFHCIRIVELLKISESATKNIFGGYSSKRMKVSNLDAALNCGDTYMLLLWLDGMAHQFFILFSILNNLKVLPLHWRVISFFCFIHLLRGNATEYSWTCVKWLHLTWSPWFKWSVFKVRNFFSSLTPISDQDWISPNNFETTLSRQVMRIKKNVN